MSPPFPPISAPPPPRTVYVITISPSQDRSAECHTCAYTSRVRANAIARRELRNLAAEFEGRPKFAEWMDEAGLFRGSAEDPELDDEADGEWKVEVSVRRVLVVEGETEEELAVKWREN